MPAKKIPPTVWLLGWVALLNDAASEMITPLLPILVTTQLGGSAMVLALIEGVAEAASSLLKLWSGRLADSSGQYRTLTLAGYLLSNSARPLIGLVNVWTGVLGLRFLDRAGKGIRTAPRDAILAASVGNADRGQVFGIHRAMDHGGAVVGPLLAMALLAAGCSVQQVFLASAVPGAVVIFILWRGLPQLVGSHGSLPRGSAADPLAGASWRRFDGRLRALIFAAVLLTLSTLPEALLLLWATQANGLSVTAVALLWSATHVCKMLLAYFAGRWSDQFGRVPVVSIGWLARIVLMMLMAFEINFGLSTAAWVVLMFLCYQSALACTEAAERALIGDTAPPALRGTAYGIYHLTCGVLVLPGVLALGWVWEHYSAAAALLVSAAGTFLSVTLLLMLSRRA